MLYYVPLESYKERYTCQLSAPKVGWLERNWIESGIEYKRINGTDYDTKNIKTGVVLDAVRRSRFAMSQIDTVLLLADSGVITNEDVFYFDDFWHPGIESLAYAFHVLGIKPKMYGFCYAQSVDEFDFTYPMRDWIRHFERGIGRVLDGIFVANTLLKNLLVDASISSPDKIHVVGLVFDSSEVKKRMEKCEKINQVVYSSRWDNEKNPNVFLKTVDEVMKHRQDVVFVVCTSAKKVRSNNPDLLVLLQQYQLMYPNNLIVKEGLSKEEYYRELSRSKIQVNTADQDWVSFTLLEASVAGCFPLYPYYRSFPETLRYEREYLYERFNYREIAYRIENRLSNPMNWSDEAIANRSWIHSRYDDTWKRMLAVMGLISTECPLYEGYGEM